MRELLGARLLVNRLEMTCNETDGARTFRRWRYYRPTWPHLQSPSWLKSTYSTRLAGVTFRYRSKPWWETGFYRYDSVVSSFFCDQLLSTLSYVVYSLTKMFNQW